MRPGSTSCVDDFCRALAAALMLCWVLAPGMAKAEGSLSLRDCRLHGASVPGSVAARCGHYSVPENPEQPQGRKISLHVALIPALRLAPAPDPLFVLSGGPGQAASDFYLSIAPALARIRRDRDIVVIDQRGTGRSNRLDCALPDDGDVASLAPESLPGLVQDCLEALPGDARFYTTSIAVRDLDQVREALGYESINLYGVSYGTRVAQHYMRRYPTRVRAAILDGAVPPEVALGPSVAIEAQQVLDDALGRCAADARCAESFPDLAQRFADLQARLQAGPLDLWLPDPVTAQPSRTVFGVAELAAAVRLLSYTDETLSLLPLLIHEAQAARRPHALAAQYLMIRRSMDRQMAMGMHFAVVCSEDGPRWSAEGITDAALRRTYLGATFMAALKSICARWPPGPVDADFNEPLRSGVPVLILSGSNDPITPSRYGEQILQELPNARHLVLQGQGHGQIGTGCMPRLAAAFIAEGKADRIDARCARTIAPAPFMLSPTATAP